MHVDCHHLLCPEKSRAVYFGVMVCALFTYKGYLGAEKMAQLAQCFPHKNEDLDSNPQNPQFKKRLKIVTCTYNPSTWEGREKKITEALASHISEL